MANLNIVTSTEKVDPAAALHDKIRWIDGLVQEATDEIEALADGAQASMECGRDLTTAVRLLRAIGARAQMLADHVSIEAEEAAPGESDDSRERRAVAVCERWQLAPTAA